jgi:CRP-like cAMP-binding protein
MLRSARDANSIRNRILAALPWDEQNRLHHHLEPVMLQRGQILSQPGEIMRWAYFPDTALISLLSLTEEGGTIEVGVLGNEGIVGIPAYLDSGSTPYRATVLISGSARKMKVDLLKAEFDRCGPLHDLLLRYLHLLVIQLAQTGACNYFHSLEQRVCRWLLGLQSRAKSNDLEFTQELLSQMLGVNRVSISQAAGRLQKAGLIRYNRGYIKILDQQGLEAAACDCYGIVRKEFDRLM